MTLFIDADACPVKAEAERVATRLRVPIVLVCNGGLRMTAHPLVSLKIVAEGPPTLLDDEEFVARHLAI